jgi:regulatory protein
MGRRPDAPWRDVSLPLDPVADGPEADPEAVARAILLHQLTGRARSRSELVEALSRKHVPDDVATRLLDRFEDVGLVDDGAFARDWVASRLAGRGLARRALAMELRRKGVADEVATEALQAVTADDETARARALVRRRLRSVGHLDQPTVVRRLTGMLARKGYSYRTALEVVREELEAAGAETSDLADDSP